MPLENVIDTTENCRYCLMCRHVAPVGHVTFQETYTPRGVALTVASQRRGLIDWNAESVGIIYSESDSGESRAHCVTDQPFHEAIAAVRAEIAGAGLAPQIVYDVHKKLEQWRTPFAEQSVSPTTETGDIALLLTDEATYLWEGIEDAILRLLDAIGIHPVVIGRGRSNGYLACSLGFPETAARQATMILDELRAAGSRQLIVIAPGDYYAVSQLYDERLGVSFPEDIELIDLTVLLSKQLDARKLSIKKSSESAIYAYIDPTHTVRTPHRVDAPRVLTQAVMNGNQRELFWRRERAHPVGNTALQFTHPDISEKLTRARLQDAKNTGAELIICEDPATLHHLRRYADEYDLRIQGLYECLAHHLN